MAVVGDRTDAYRVWSGDLMEPLGRPRPRGENKIKMNVQEVGWRCGLD